MLIRKQGVKVALVLTALWVLGVFTFGCTTLKSDEAKPGTAKAPASAAAPTVYQDFGDVLVPSTLKVNSKDSFVMHSAGTTSGVLLLSGRVDANSLVTFFENRMPQDGWRKTGTFRGPRSLILFNKENRWCVIRISEGRLTTEVEIWVAPTLQPLAGTTLTR
jgi:hypothetical protein